MILLDQLGIRFTDHSQDPFSNTHFETPWVFRNLNLHVRRGESVVLIGPSGSGKSVLLKLVAGLLEPSEGSILVRSNNIGMLFQQNALFDSFTVEENLLFPLKERLGVTGTKAKEKAADFLSYVGLSGTENLHPSSLSGGMQKRLGIARALIVEPSLILYDEPTAGLDPITSRSIADLILMLKKQSGSTVLTVTNDVNRAYQLGDQIHLLAQGELTFGGSPEETKTSCHPALRQFVLGSKQGPLELGTA